MKDLKTIILQQQQLQEQQIQMIMLLVQKIKETGTNVSFTSDALANSIGQFTYRPEECYIFAVDSVTYAGVANSESDKFKLHKIYPDWFKYLIFVKRLTFFKDSEIR